MLEAEVSMSIEVCRCRLELEVDMWAINYIHFHSIKSKEAK